MPSIDVEDAVPVEAVGDVLQHDNTGGGVLLLGVWQGENQLNEREKELLGGVLVRLLQAVDALDDESTFRNISFGERQELYKDIYELRDGKRPELVQRDGEIFK